MSSTTSFRIPNGTPLVTERTNELPFKPGTSRPFVPLNYLTQEASMTLDNLAIVIPLFIFIAIYLAPERKVGG